MNPLPYILLETANFHGGDPEQMLQAIETFSALDYPHKCIKFHPFKADNVALPDFSWYPMMKKFYIDPLQWEEIIDIAVVKTFKVWLEIICMYGVEILKMHWHKISGIKFQPALLDNPEIIERLRPLNWRDKELLINISGLEITQIEKIICRLEEFDFKQVILQLGFQHYPVQLEDTSLNKLEILQAVFPTHPLAYADHIDARTEFSRNFPVYAWFNGCTYIEKHICNSRSNTQFDFDSALELSEIKALLAELQRINQCFTPHFISENEKAYYSMTLPKPVLQKSLNKGQLVAPEDLISRHTNTSGLTHEELTDAQQKFLVLNKSLTSKSFLTLQDFKRARIGVIVDCQFKSSWRKEIALQKIRGLSAIERCLENCLKFPFIDHVILATTTLEKNTTWQNVNVADRVKFCQVDSKDVLNLYLGVCQEYDLDVVVWVTGDSPVVAPEITATLLSAHFQAGADITEVQQCAQGTSCRIYNVEALQRAAKMAGKENYTDHISAYIIQNTTIFKVYHHNLPPEFVRDYRLILDFPEDLDMFNALFGRLEELNLENTLHNIFWVLDKEPDIAKMNAARNPLLKNNPINYYELKTREKSNGK